MGDRRSHLYKKQGRFITTLEQRIENDKENRKSIRHENITKRRKILTSKNENNVEVQSKRVPTRLEMLIKWKAEKAKHKEMQKKLSKPIFKVSHVHAEIGLPNLETINKEIKGKRFK